MNQCWFILDWNIRNKLQCNSNRYAKIFIRENAFQNGVWKMMVICFGLNMLKLLYYPVWADITGVSPDYWTEARSNIDLCQGHHGKISLDTHHSNFPNNFCLDRKLCVSGGGVARLLNAIIIELPWLWKIKHICDTCRLNTVAMGQSGQTRFR